jgi:5'-hydroxyaverantin dehydrogenase
MYPRTDGSRLTSTTVGARGIFRSLRQTTAAMTVRVNFIAPAWIDTPLLQSAQKEMEASGFKVKTANIDLVVDAMVRSALDESVGGKAWAIFPGGYADFKDDELGGWGPKRARERNRVKL